MIRTIVKFCQFSLDFVQASTFAIYFYDEVEQCFLSMQLT